MGNPGTVMFRDFLFPQILDFIPSHRVDHGDTNLNYQRHTENGDKSRMVFDVF